MGVGGRGRGKGVAGVGGGVVARELLGNISYFC